MSESVNKYVVDTEYNCKLQLVSDSKIGLELMSWLKDWTVTCSYIFVILLEMLCFFSLLRIWSRWSRHYLGPGAEIKFLINIFCRQFGGCYDEDKLISSSISIVLLF